jgi:hypothetical protein
VNCNLNECQASNRQLFTHLSLHRPGLDLMPVSVRLVVDKMTVGQVSYRVLQFFTVSIIPPMLHTHGYLNVIVCRMTSK